MSPFNEQSIVSQVNSAIAAKLQTLGMDEEEQASYREFIASFNQVAAGELAKEEKILLPGSNDEIAIDETKALQALSLFSEGIFHCLTRCREYHLEGEILNHLAQQVAMHVYEQTKQIVAATHGQENTPELQFTMEQQTAFINQAADAALQHYINEYEKAYGPIHPLPEEKLGPEFENLTIGANPTPEQPPEAPFINPEAVTDPPSPQVASAQPSHTHASQLNQHEKYAAIALLLTTLNAQQRAKILAGFSPEEKELVAFYSYPQHIEQNLNTQNVATYLKQLSAVFKRQGRTEPQEQVHSGLKDLANQYPKEKLLSCVQDERGVIQAFIHSLYPETTYILNLAGQASQSPTYFLSPRLQKILFQYISKQLIPLRQPSIQG